MTSGSTKRRWKHLVSRAVVEIGFILFLFYANLLMGEYTRDAPPGRTLQYGLRVIFTYKNFGIGIFAAVVGYVVFERLRKET